MIEETALDRDFDLLASREIDAQFSSTDADEFDSV